jgi:MATE family multidrug resistance protein
MAIILWVYTYKKHPGSFKFHSTQAKELLFLGLAISVSVLFEVMMFTTITVLAGTMGILNSAAHNIALHLASLTFMVPLGLSSACTVRVAQQLGKKDYVKLHKYALAGLQTGAGFMCLSAAAYLFYPEVLARLMSDDKELITASAGLLFYVAIFQISDGIQVVLMGILRGLSITKRPTILAFIGNWIFGFPLSLYLAYEKEMLAKGLWLGLAFGLSFMAISLGILYMKVRPQEASV